MKAAVLLAIPWFAACLSGAAAQVPPSVSRLNREVALQKLRVQENAALRRHFSRAGFKEDEAVQADTYQGADSEGEFQMDVVAKEMAREGRRVVVTTVEFRQGGQVVLLTAADDEAGNVVQVLAGGIRVLHPAGSAAGQAGCTSTQTASTASCHACRTQFGSCAGAAQPLHKKVKCLFAVHASQTCRNCLKTSVLSLVRCLF